MSSSGSLLDAHVVRDQLHQRGLRWTPQRRAILEVLKSSAGHLTAGDLLERCRQIDPEVTPSTVYRTLDTLEGLGLIVHSHGADGREEYHVEPEAEHAHLVCETCGTTWELDRARLGPIVDDLDRTRGFAVSVSHLTISGVCEDCREPRSDIGRR